MIFSCWQANRFQNASGSQWPEAFKILAGLFRYRDWNQLVVTLCCHECSWERIPMTLGPGTSGIDAAFLNHHLHYCHEGMLKRGPQWQRLVSRAESMTDRDSCGHSYFAVWGEILGCVKDRVLRKHLPRIFHWSQTKMRGWKTIRCCPSLNHNWCRLEIGCCYLYDSWSTLWEIQLLGLRRECGRKAET